MQVWYRVVAVGVKHGKVALQSLGLGDHLQAVALSHLLHRLPASSLSGLAVRWHKAMIRPQASESRKITGTSWP